MTDGSFLLDDAPHSLPQRLWREAVWGIAMGCLAHNVARSTAMRWTRVVWWGQRWLERVVGRER